MIKITTTILNFQKICLFVCLMVLTYSPSLMNNIVMYIVLFNIICLFVFNATFNNISIISWRSVLLAEETRGPGENH